MKKLFISGAAAMSLATSAWAATLDGSTVGYELTNENVGTVQSGSFTAGPGLDANKGVFSIDVNTMLPNNGVGFKMVMEPGASIPGLVTGDGSLTSLILTTALPGPYKLKDFIVTKSSSIFDSVDILSGSMISFNFTDMPFTNGESDVILAGEYVIATPLPAGGVLLLGGLGALGVAARRRRKANK
ncbi:MAG: VPLPA-CTERM sorting domain-containing protein [Marinibacterium sp.]